MYQVPAATEGNKLYLISHKQETGSLPSHICESPSSQRRSSRFLGKVRYTGIEGSYKRIIGFRKTHPSAS